MNIEKIWGEYAVAIKQFLMTRVGIAADVDDLLQEVLIKSHSNLATVKDPDNIKSWLFQIANNTLIDYYRQKGRSDKPAATELWFEDENHNGSNARGDEVKEDLLSCLLPFINALEPEYRDLLLAIDIEKKPQKDYAQQLGISYSTLKSRVQKGRMLLRGVFDQCCHFDKDRLGNVFEYHSKRKK